LLINKCATIEVYDRTADYTPTLRFLIDRGADVNYVTAKGDTPLFRAISWRKIDMLRVLLEHGADLNAKWDGMTAADYAEGEDPLEMCEILKDAMSRRSRSVAETES
jgi:ankyrin repeat protein